MAFVVRVTGPEFLSEESRESFARIEESIRQFSVHTRESIYLIRKPLGIGSDHFVVLWSHGAGIVGLYDRGGILRGHRRGPWVQIEQLGDRSRDITFENPMEQLASAREEAQGLIRRMPIGQGVLAESAVGEEPESSDSEPQRISPEAESARITTLAIFTMPVKELRLEGLPIDSGFAAMSIEDAMSRTMFHMPTLLRSIDTQAVVYSNADLRAIATVLEKSSAMNSGNGSAREHAVSEAGNNRLSFDAGKSSRNTRRAKWWIAPAVVVIALVMFFVGRSVLAPSPGANISKPPPTAPPAVRPPSEMVIQLPAEIQVLVSPSVYASRSELDRALARGEGQRYLPSTEQDLVLDSLTFAKGVYGYFKVDNAWRKGKLLQTFQSHDTIKIDNFLAPLP